MDNRTRKTEKKKTPDGSEFPKERCSSTDRRTHWQTGYVKSLRLARTNEMNRYTLSHTHKHSHIHTNTHTHKHTHRPGACRMICEATDPLSRWQLPMCTQPGCLALRCKGVINSRVITAFFLQTMCLHTVEAFWSGNMMCHLKVEHTISRWQKQS